MAPEAEASHQVGHSKNYLDGLRCASISRTHLLSRMLSSFSIHPTAPGEISWASGNVVMTLDLVSASLAIRAHWNSLPHHNHYHFIPASASFPYLISLLANTFRWQPPLDFCGPKSSVYLTSVHGSFWWWSLPSIFPFYIPQFIPWAETWLA